jgi:hypothetical protein
VEAVHWNFALDDAIERARQLNKPLVIFGPPRCGFAWAWDDRVSSRKFSSRR